jgi:hypothetical protein
MGCIVNLTALDQRFRVFRRSSPQARLPEFDQEK